MTDEKLREVLTELENCNSLYCRDDMTKRCGKCSHCNARAALADTKGTEPQ